MEITVLNSTFPVLTLLVLLPALAALALWLIKPTRIAARQIGLAVSALVLLGTIYLALNFDYGKAAAYQFAETHSWIRALGVSWALGVNGLGLAMLVLSALLTLIVLIASARDLEGENKPYDDAGYVGLTLATLAFMMLIFAARDVFVFYLAFEAMLVPMFFLVGRYGNGAKRKAAAMKFLLYSLAGGLVMLIGIVGIYVYSPLAAASNEQHASLYLIENLAGKLQASPGVEMALMISFFIAFAVKAPMVPVHTWLADTAENARPGTSALLVGILDKIGTFGMITLCLTLFPNASRRAALAFIILAVISVIWGSLAALAQKDLMRLISFTSVAHFGLMVLGIYVGNTVALAGAMVYMVAHGLSIAGMFLIGGFLTERGHSQDIEAYGGMQRVTPLIAGTFLISGLAAIALPGLSGFVPELMVLIGTFRLYQWAAVLCLVGVVAGAVYVLLPYQKIFTGKAPEHRKSIKDLDNRERWGVAAPLIVLMLVIGLHPQPLVDPMSQVADQVIVTQDVAFQVEGTGK
ncbi:NADH-quinone oxidoreductase subunit M [Varibaculum cambriense]|uniref:NADH-quinone oxidoreductase subunit M n=1 Tax=Varibaculum cambriense TaxID=184870 RepID=UPI0039F44ADC